MTVSLALNLDSPTGITRTVLHLILATFTITALLLLGKPIFRRIWSRKITIEHLFATALLGTLSASIFSSFTQLGHIYYEVIIILLTIYHFGQIILVNYQKKAENISQYIPGLVGRARKIKNNEIEVIESSSVQVGDEFLVKENEIIPTDGYIVKGEAFIEQLAHTGEPFPKPIHVGGKVFAGSKVLDGTITVRSRCSAGEREIDRLYNSISPEKIKPETLHSAQKLLNIFVPFIFTVVALTFFYWAVKGTFSKAIFNSLAVTVVACPCGIGLGIPLVARKGFLNLKLLGLNPQKSDLLQRLAEIDTVAFDKTGTLTSANLILDKIEYQSAVPEEFEKWVTTIQRSSAHPVAKPFWKLSNAISIPELKVENLPAQGIRATFFRHGKEQVIEVGNNQILDKDAVQTSENRTIYIKWNGDLVAIADLKETYETENVSLLKKLKSSHYKLLLLTGDNQCPEAFSHYTETQISLTSEDKKKVLKELQRQGKKVLFVGDGQNDVEAFSEAYTSFALRSGTTVARKVAHAELNENNLSSISDVLLYAKRYKSEVKRLFLFTISYNVLGVSLAALGLLHPIWAALLMLTASFTVLLLTSSSTSSTRYSLSSDGISS